LLFTILWIALYDKPEMEENWTIARIAEELKISYATLRNWYRNGSLDLFRDPEIGFPLNREQKALLCDQIKQSGRLQKRANRKDKTELPGVYGSVKRWTSESGLKPEQQIFLFLKSLGDTGLWAKNQQRLWKIELDQWPDHTEGVCPAEILQIFLKKCPDDPAGALLQHLQSASSRIQQGRFFTPESWVNRLFSRQKIHRDLLFLDPAMGTGRFVSACIERGGNPDKVHGIEKDPLSFRIARMNLLLQTERNPETLPLYLGDAFDVIKERGWTDSMDLVMTNPPWGSPKGANPQEFPLAPWNKDLYTAFIWLAKQVLKEKGTLTYLIPQSLLNQKKYASLREEILRKGSLQWVDLSYELIPGIQSPPMGLSWKKSEKSFSIQVYRDKISYKRDLRNNKTDSWDLRMTPKDKDLENRLYIRAGRTLKDLDPQWILGIVTGDNRNRLSRTPAKPGTGLIGGKDIKEGKIAPCSLFLTAPWEDIQQCARKELYRHPCKVVYRFIYPYPVASIDRQGRYLLNSCNAVILKETREMELLCHLLNSTLYREYYRKKYHSMKILRSHLEELPFPLLNEKEWKALSPVLKNPYPKGFETWLRRYYQLEEGEGFCDES